jgi:DNA-binding XRE family transcriptional regulator
MPKVKKTTSKVYHPPYSKFQGFCKENRITLKDIGDLLGLTLSTVCSKNNGQADYKMEEINKICDHFGVSSDIFRTQKVS